jgi:hypothetical protein
MSIRRIKTKNKNYINQMMNKAKDKIDLSKE